MILIVIGITLCRCLNRWEWNRRFANPIGARRYFLLHLASNRLQLLMNYWFVIRINYESNWRIIVDIINPYIIYIFIFFNPYIIYLRICRNTARAWRDVNSFVSSNRKNIRKTPRNAEIVHESRLFRLLTFDLHSSSHLRNSRARFVRSSRRRKYWKKYSTT